MKPKILEQEAKMNRFKREVALKLYFKNQKTRENQRNASGYTKVIMELQPQNRGALLPYQYDNAHSIPRLMIKDILNQNIAGKEFLKHIYKGKIQIRKVACFRPLNRLILSELELKLKELENAKSL